MRNQTRKRIVSSGDRISKLIPNPAGFQHRGKSNPPSEFLRIWETGKTKFDPNMIRPKGSPFLERRELKPARPMASERVAARPSNPNVISARDFGLREGLVKAAERWGAVTVDHGTNTSREKGLLVQAYADAYGIKLVHSNEKGQGGRFTATELARLPELRRQARAEHLSDIVRFRTKRAAHGALRALGSGAFYVARQLFKAAMRILQFLVIGIPSMVGRAIARRARRSAFKIRSWASDRRVRKAILTAIGLYVLFGIAWGFDTPIHFSKIALHWGIRHPHTVWHATRILSGSGFVLWVLIIVSRFLDRHRPPEPVYVPPPAPSPPPVPVRRYEIENFRQKNAFGDASLAQRNQIARALLGNGGYAPTFED
jgi:hypothetical protein